MSFELEGVLLEVYDTQQVTNTFKKREFVVETREEKFGREFVETIKFQLTQDRCDLLEEFQKGRRIKVSFDIKGRRWEKNGNVNYFNNLEAWRLEAASSAQNEQTPPPPSPEDFPMSDAADEEDLPF